MITTEHERPGDDIRVREDESRIKPDWDSDVITRPLVGEYRTIQQFAYLLNCHPRTLQRWIREGHYPPTMRTPGGHPRWSPADIDYYLRVTA